MITGETWAAWRAGGTWRRAEMETVFQQGSPTSLTPVVQLKLSASILFFYSVAPGVNLAVTVLFL